MIDDNEFPEVGLAADGGPQQAAPAGGSGQAEEAFPDLGSAAMPPPSATQPPSRRSVDFMLLLSGDLWLASCSSCLHGPIQCLQLLSLSVTGQATLYRLPMSKTCLLLWETPPLVLYPSEDQVCFIKGHMAAPDCLL